MTLKLQASRRLTWSGGRKPDTVPLLPRGAFSCPILKLIERWNSHAADSDGWYGCTSPYWKFQCTGLCWQAKNINQL